MRDYRTLGLAYSQGSGLLELQAETLRLVTLGTIPAMLCWLVLGSVDLEVRRQPGMWLVALALAATGALPNRLAEDHPRLAAVALAAGLLGTILVALAVYPGSQMLFALVLVSMVAATFLGLAGYLAGSAAGSAAALALTLPNGAWPAAEAGPVVGLIWGCGIICWLATRPTRVALDWSWTSYVQALEMTEALRDRQGELVRTSHDLAVACDRLETANRELDRARREAETARRLKSQFAAAISHELRTPLNLIIGFSEMITQELRTRSIVLSSPRHRGDLEAIYRGACHISSLIDDVLDLSQVDAHRLALQKRQTPLTQIVEEARATLSTLFDEAGLSLRIDLPADLPLLNVDPLRIRQVLINLLNNSVRHTDDGEIAITASTDGSQIVVSVRDTGEGIAASDLPWVFEAFRQIGEAGRRRGGSGLGLAITKRFVEMHGGNIWVESKLGEGTVFHFSLPLQGQIVAEPASPDWDRLLGPRPSNASERTLLVVDADPESGQILRRYLDGYQVLAAADLAEADRLARKESAQALVITDPHLADVSRGSEWLTRPGASRLPVLTCSLRTRRQIGQELGVAAYLVKPVSRDALIAALRASAKPIRGLLIVDDDSDLASLLERMVTSSLRRCRVALASDGVEALVAMRSRRPDVVLLDLLMPKMDGYEVLAEMRADSTLRDIPVIVVTARGTHEETITANSLNISRVGGLTVAELVTCVRACLDSLLAPPGDKSSQEPPGEPAG